jgi:tetratricopeptide (TPR) repeat protein
VRQNAEALRTAIGIYENAGDLEKLEVLLLLYVKAHPSDWQSWLALASLNAAKGKMDAAASAMESAVQYGGEQVAPLIEKSPSLMQVYQHLVKRRREAAKARMPGAPVMPRALPGAR